MKYIISIYTDIAHRYLEIKSMPQNINETFICNICDKKESTFLTLKMARKYLLNINFRFPNRYHPKIESII